CAIGNSSGDVF
nr:immunoglobulin light chain junction region [Macaca mulatta]